MSIAAYKQTIKETEDPRLIERRVIAQITMALEKNAAEPPQSRELKDALLRNQRLWNTFRVDSMVDGNRLPLDLRASIISLATFVDRHTASILVGEGQVSDLIAINRTIIAGLGGAAPATAS